MPQLSKGGKFIFGWCLIRDNGLIKLPSIIIDEYGLSDKTHIFLVTGSKQTGGFSLMPKHLLESSELSNILRNNPSLVNLSIKEGELIKYKGRRYCWLSITSGRVELNNSLLHHLDISIGDKLLAIRSSNIAFTLGAKGRIYELAEQYPNDIEVF